MHAAFPSVGGTQMGKRGLFQRFLSGSGICFHF